MYLQPLELSDQDQKINSDKRYFSFSSIPFSFQISFFHISFGLVLISLFVKLFALLYQFMDKSQEYGWCSLTHLPEQSPTLSSIIDTIEFQKKPKVRSTKTCSETDSIASCQSIETKEKSKVWTPQEIELFGILLRKYGTDFHILSAFFPKKTKNQLKNRYKLYMNLQRKREKTEENNLKAISQLFREVEEMDERDQKDDQSSFAKRM